MSRREALAPKWLIPIAKPLTVLEETRSRGACPGTLPGKGQEISPCPIFGRIKDAIFGKPAQAATPAAEAPAIPLDAAPAAIGEVDVLANLAAMPGASGLNYKSSIVDLLKLVGINSSLDNRKELAMELGYTGDLEGSAEMNIWLHKATMKALAENGGKVPAELLD